MVTLHYCHNHFSDFKVYGTYEDGCCESNCGFSHKCCTFETISGKITQEHVTSDKDTVSSPKELLAGIFTFEPRPKEQFLAIVPFIINSSPPKDIPILNCSLTFYG